MDLEKYERLLAVAVKGYEQLRKLCHTAHIVKEMRAAIEEAREDIENTKAEEIVE